jgi:hypothetical protein
MTKHKTKHNGNFNTNTNSRIKLIYFSRKDAMKKDVIEVAKTAKAMSI